MSEFQYYEFQAIDRSLDARQMQHLRGFSTRARITPTSFVNEYQWGSFKGDEDAWMERYFDAFLYFANWGTRTVMLRLPARLLDPAIAHSYHHNHTLTVREKNGHVILSFCSNDEGGDDTYDLEGAGLLASLIPVRAELARGDLRALYLGWLVAVATGELDDETVEPLVPPGLGQLSGSLQAFASFLRVDPDLLHVAAQLSPAQADQTPRSPDVAAWLATLPLAEKDKILTRLIVESDHATLPAELLQRFHRFRDTARPATASSPAPRRTVGTLLRAADACTAEREQAAARHAAAEKERLAREAAAARTLHLDRLAGQQPRLWSDVDRLIATKLPKNYDQAVQHLVDLRDLAHRAGVAATAACTTRLAALRTAHARKPTLLDRLTRTGL